jgi:hypothetical protein
MTYLDDTICKCQPKAWFSEDIMLEWVNDVLVPHVVMVPPGIVPILFLDSFKVHMMGNIVTKIQALGVEVEFIPLGCNGLVQSVDVGYNKAFKAKKVKNQYNDWLMAQDPNAPIAKTTCRHIIEWVLAAKKNINTEMICNAWCKMGFSYFLD